MAVHLAAGAVIFTLAGAFAVTGAWIEAAGNAVLGLGIAFAGLVPFRAYQPVGLMRTPDVFALLMGLAAALAGLATLAMLAVPGLAQLSGAAVYAPSRAILPWYGAAFLAGGLALLAAHLYPRSPPPARWAAHLLAAGAFLGFVGMAALPARLWTAVAYFGTFGVLLALLPWLGSRLDQLDPASLRMRLALALAGVAALPLILAMALVTDRQLQVARGQALAQQQTLAAALAQAVADYVGLHQAAVVALAAHPGLAGMAPEAQRPLLRALSASYPDLVALGTLDAAGNPVARGDNGPLAALPGRSLYESHRTSAPSVMVIASPGGEGPLLLLGAPIVEPDGTFGGLATGAVESARLASLLVRAGAGVGGEAYLVDARTGHVLAHPDASLAASFADLSRRPPVAALLAAGGAPGAVRYQVGGDERLAGYAPVPDLRWGVVVEVPPAAALAGALAARDLAFGTLLLGIAAAALAGVAIAGSLAAPLGRLARAADRLAAGAFSGPVPQSPITEVAYLANAFQDLSDRLAARTAERERAEAALRRNEAQYRELFENANDVVYTHDLDGTSPP
jgi:HAMP domain-containing protein